MNVYRLLRPSDGKLLMRVRAHSENNAIDILETWAGGDQVQPPIDSDGQQEVLSYDHAAVIAASRKCMVEVEP